MGASSKKFLVFSLSLLILAVFNSKHLNGDGGENAALNRAISGTLSKSPVPGAFWGVSVMDLNDGRLLAGHNQNRLFVPASILKIVTALAAWERFGPDHRFSTEILTDGELDARGNLTGNLIIQGGGDPSWSFQFHENDFEKPVRSFCDNLLEQCAIRSIEGSILGDDTRFLYKPYGPSWSWEVFQWRYGSKVSALSLNDNVVRIRIQPGKEGQLIKVKTYPSFYEENVRIETRTQRSAGLDDLVAYKPFDSDIYYLSGSFPAGQASWNLKVSVSDPALFFARCLEQELMNRGVSVASPVLVRHRTHYQKTTSIPGSLTRLASIPGLTLAEILEPTLKRSVNIYSELILRNIGVGSPSKLDDEREKGTRQILAMWPDICTPGENISLEDGSGLSRRNLITPLTLTRILNRAGIHSNFNNFRDLLPLSGVDGTLKARLDGPLRGRVWGKTGLLEQVASIAGYIRTRSGHWVSFCIITNNHPAHKENARRTIDALVRDIFNHS